MANASAPHPGPAHRRLDVFVGGWQMTGRQFETSFGPAAPVQARERYDWLPGGFFLVHRFDGKLGEQDMACIEVIGPDGAGGYFQHAFYNDGLAMHWRAQERDGRWTIEGDWPAQPQPVRVRCTVRFAAGNRSRHAVWERSSDGRDWQTFWDVTATRQDPRE
ncbi:MAG TPA: DUF1579 family protein [Albitalea sp.]|uniref:DUF1579 family protein n=1 Tax=Piscinibacter sp. TaxID=1903157 RepID=UPI002ED4B5BE